MTGHRKVLLTGARGFIGGRLEKKMWGMNVVPLDRKDGVDVLDDFHMLDVDLIYHLAGQTDVSNSFTDMYQDARDNVMTMVKLMQLFPHVKIIYTSSAATLDIQSPYGLSKKTAQDYLMKFHKGPKVTCILPNLFGPGGKGVIERFIEADTLMVDGSGNQSREFVHVDDIAEGLFQARNWHDGTYKLGSGRQLTVNQLAEATGKPIVHGRNRKGDIYESYVGNVTPRWRPEIDPIQYIKERCNVK
jgi:UDP-glucuronate decarboxylase